MLFILEINATDIHDILLILFSFTVAYPVQKPKLSSFRFFLSDWACGVGSYLFLQKYMLGWYTGLMDNHFGKRPHSA